MAPALRHNGLPRPACGLRSEWGTAITQTLPDQYAVQVLASGCIMHAGISAGPRGAMTVSGRWAGPGRLLFRGGKLLPMNGTPLAEWPNREIGSPGG